MPPPDSGFSPVNSGLPPEVLPDGVTVQELETYDDAPIGAQSHTSQENNESKRIDEKTLSAGTRKRPRAPTPDDDDADRRVRARTNTTPPGPTVPDHPLTTPSVPADGQPPEIMQIMTNLAAVTGQIVASTKDESSTNSSSTRKTVADKLREVLKMLVPCVTKVRSMGALGVDILGLANLVDSSLGREGILTIISSPYASSIPKPLVLYYTDYFAVGDTFWDRQVEFAADQTLEPGEKAAPSSQGLVCVAFRLHIVTKVTPVNMWTTVGRLHGKNGLSHLHKDDLWMHLHLHDSVHGQLPRNGLLRANDTPHESLTYRRVTNYRHWDVHKRTHFSAVDAVPHIPSEGMKPLGSLDEDSRDLLMGLKAIAHSPDGEVFVRPKGMNVDAVKSGLRQANHHLPGDMPRPHNAQGREHLFGQLRTHPSKKDSTDLIRESSTFSSAYSASVPQAGEAKSSVDQSRDQSSKKVNPSQVMSQPRDSPASHSQQQAQAPDAVREGRNSTGEKADTTATGLREALPHANMKSQTGPISNQPAMAQVLNQTHSGAMVNPILNVTEQQQSLNINQPVSGPPLSPGRKGRDGGV
ncbi:uncharacterized protein J4E84_010644 [Alternaria hordeiaustralica]|uniref:uncharacterized protein n=1 Tax=Alternaria hordeiaustralica TaxID=1187925 RepID=UPI0020C4F1AD|nr:uncharacterized protein J4E84_010644 [Alternaria hordeiaustralica]KAI4674269.1 hypothetical protein J4E84_010644 [Alternaria hordeiaustralica]